MENLGDMLTVFLRLFWFSGTLPIIVGSLPFSGLSSLYHGLVILAGRGKIMKSSSSKFTVPQRYFLHFYLVALILTTWIWISTLLYAFVNMIPSSDTVFWDSQPDSQLARDSHIRCNVWRTVFVLLLMEVQVTRRLYETVFVFDYSCSARMHLLGYLTGLFFYVAAPLSLCSSCLPEVLSYTWGIIAELCFKDHEKMITHSLYWSEFSMPLAQLGWLQWFGAIIFIWGWLHQLQCHSILGSLRKKRGADQYLIPHGDWFEYASSPHYLAEIVIYAGILIASGGSDLTIWLLFVFVVSNLSLAAAETHKWYHLKFENYPPFRHAIIPGFF